MRVYLHLEKISVAADESTEEQSVNQNFHSWNPDAGRWESASKMSRFRFRVRAHLHNKKSK
jgi:hypothetical protein